MSWPSTVDLRLSRRFAAGLRSTAILFVSHRSQTFDAAVGPVLRSATGPQRAFIAVASTPRKAGQPP